MTVAYSNMCFTRREVDVLVLVAMEFANSEIGTKLGISIRTVETHVRNMLHKSGRRSRAGLVAHGYASGILQHGVWPPQRSGQVARRGHAA
ncbi:response regulator transcription factor [Nonomuraea sp. NPDC050556]|uniref:response regulator transcription factor n=1 Tax=Nonomuraea sp. NPDC050556 TaxID=3364369 RepID=UPI0037B130AA